MTLTMKNHSILSSTLPNSSTFKLIILWSLDYEMPLWKIKSLISQKIHLIIPHLKLGMLYLSTINIIFNKFGRNVSKFLSKWNFFRAVRS
jgi:hypothetical protein